MSESRSALHHQPRETHQPLPESLGADHLGHLACTVAATAPNWTVELYDEALGTATIIIMPEDADDEIGPTSFVHREGGAFCLDQLHWDSYSALGRFEDLGDVARAVRARLLSQSLMVMPTSMTIH